MFGDINHKERVSYLVSTILNLPYEEVKEETEKKTKQGIAKSMKEKEMDINLISELTGLTKEEIEEL